MKQKVDYGFSCNLITKIVFGLCEIHEDKDTLKVDLGKVSEDFDFIWAHINKSLKLTNYVRALFGLGYLIKVGNDVYINPWDKRGREFDDVQKILSEEEWKIFVKGVKVTIPDYYYIGCDLDKKLEIKNTEINKLLEY